MARLWLVTVAAAFLALLLYGAGCTRPGIETGDDGGSKDCKSLDESGCAAAGSACVADYCSACSCTSSFAACRRPGDAATICPLYGCPTPQCTCDGLPESACIASEKSLGCTPGYCPDCRGGQIFSGCFGPNSGSGACPASCPIETCHNDKECTSGESCLAPGQSAGCGACRIADSCTNDGSCNPGEICGIDLCVCNNSGMSCVPGCAQTGCAEGQTCANTNHCVATWCQKPNDCPAQFECVVGTGCQRKSCSSDNNCPGGFCVENQCYSSLGQCQFPAP